MSKVQCCAEIKLGSMGIWGITKITVTVDLLMNYTVTA